jgi:hypothetical protein
MWTIGRLLSVLSVIIFFSSWEFGSFHYRRQIWTRLDRCCRDDVVTIMFKESRGKCVNGAVFLSSLALWNAVIRISQHL